MRSVTLVLVHIWLRDRFSSKSLCLQDPNASIVVWDLACVARILVGGSGNQRWSGIW